MDFRLEVTRSGAGTVIAVSGDLDVYTAPRLRDQMAEVIDSGERNLMVDLTPCEFIDSSGLSALVTALKRIRADGGDLGIVCPPGNVRRLIEVVALDQIFDIRDGIEPLES